MKKSILFVIVILASFSVFAHGDYSEDITTMQEQLLGQELQGSFAKYMSDERINLNIGLQDGKDLDLGITTENKVITQFDEVTLENPTLEIHTTEDTLNTILESENSLMLIAKALNEGTIQYKANGFFNKIKYGVIVSMIKNKAR